jgi:hypothetical protein
VVVRQISGEQVDEQRLKRKSLKSLAFVAFLVSDVFFGFSLSAAVFIVPWLLLLGLSLGLWWKSTKVIIGD